MNIIDHGFNRIEIFQIKDIANCNYAFRSYEEAEETISGYTQTYNGLTKEWGEKEPIYGVRIEDYKKVYEYDEWFDSDAMSWGMSFLDTIYCKFNECPPNDFEGHSLSVSDLIRVNEESWYYVDYIGFKYIGDFESGFKDTYDFRICDECGAVMTDGFVVDGGAEYYCDEDCLHQHYSEEEWIEMCENDEDTYWTQWN